MLRSLREYYEEEGKSMKRYDTSSFWEARYHRKRRKNINTILRSHGHIHIFLDVGCGTGEYLTDMSKFCDEIIGLDISFNYLKRVKNLRNKKPLLVQADAQALPFKDKCVDYILCSETIEHLPNPDVAIREISRVAREGFLISTPNFGFLRALMTKISKSFVRELDKNVGHINILSLHQLHEKILKTNCKIKLEKTIHVIPPIVGEKLHLPKWMSYFFDIFELFIAKLFLKTGNIAIVECTFS